jgi:hypothetical protein
LIPKGHQLILYWVMWASQLEWPFSTWVVWLAFF